MQRLLLALATVGALGVAGCGSSGDGDTNTVGGPAEGGDDKAQLAFAKCMRENGINIPDPGAGGGPQRVRIPRSVNRQVLERATETCRDKTGGGPPELTAEQREEFRDSALKFARCMRGEGIDMPDPQVSGNGGIMIRRGQRGSINPDSPAFQRAEEKCRELMPRIRRGGDGGGAGGADGGDAR